MREGDKYELSANQTCFKAKHACNNYQLSMNRGRKWTTITLLNVSLQQKTLMEKIETFEMFIEKELIVWNEENRHWKSQQQQHYCRPGQNWIESLLTVEQFQAARYLTLLHTDKIRIRWSCSKKSTEPHKKNCSTELHSGGKDLLCSAPLRLEYNSYFHVNYTYTETCT